MYIYVYTLICKKNFQVKNPPSHTKKIAALGTFCIVYLYIILSLGLTYRIL